MCLFVIVCNIRSVQAWVSWMGICLFLWCIFNKFSPFYFIFSPTDLIFCMISECEMIFFNKVRMMDLLMLDISITRYRTVKARLFVMRTVNKY